MTFFKIGRPKEKTKNARNLQMLEKLDGKKDIQFTKSIQDYFNILLKRFRSSSDDMICIFII
jgi:hypothetical protein